MEYERRLIITHQSHSTSEYRYSICGGCSAMVQDEDVHDKWHEGLASTAREAYKASSWMTPIA